MVSGYGILAKRTKSVIMVGAEKPQFARAMGYPRFSEHLYDTSI
jgi:isoaspartyl peptidase/L-asparaginase-like protein (Ntn-hydrolase superfamily)